MVLFRVSHCSGGQPPESHFALEFEETDVLIQSGTDKMPGEHFKTDAETRWPLDPREGILSSTAPGSQE